MKVSRGLPRLPRRGQRTDPNPRIDRIVAKPRGRLRRWLGMAPRTRVLRGAPTPAADLGNLSGARPVPSGWCVVCDVVVPQNMVRPRVAFSGPFDVRTPNA